VEPRIQYAKTKDGVSIGYWTLGEGTPLVSMPNFPFCHLEKLWQVPVYRRVFERASERRKLVTYDSRGCGMSERDVTDFSLEAHVLDLEAVVDHLGLDSFALQPHVNAGPVGITCAARHPERVSHLVLTDAFARGSEHIGSTRFEALLGLLDKDWELFTETMARSGYGWAQEDLGRQVAAILQESVTQEAALAIYRAIGEFDASSLLGRVKSPTLVLHRRDLVIADVGRAQGLASRIPGARLAVVDDIESLGRAIDEFLGEGEEAQPADSGAFRTILFTDVEGSTALTDRLGDARARDLLRQHERMVREALKSHGGSEVKALGDGFMTSFSSATKALECAIAMQRAFAQHNESAEEPILVRVGLNAGEPIAEDDDLHGTAVIEASRITAAAKGGEILVADVVRQLAKGKGFLFADRGETSLKGFEEPVRLYEVTWRD
jgi:class 3 adenylate cyclase